MANTNTKACVLVRDCFTCRHCGVLLFLPQAVKVIDWRYSDLELWDAHGKKEPLRSRWATVDHITSEDEGGMDTLDNLAACCVTCNSRKGGTTLQPCYHLPDGHTWDGLSSLFLALADEYADRLSHEDRKWLNALRREGVLPRSDHAEAIAAALRAPNRKVQRHWTAA